MFSRVARTFAKQSGAEFKKALRAGENKIGLFINSASPIVSEQLGRTGYDWLLVDCQHGPTGYSTMHHMLSGIGNGDAHSMVRVQGYNDRAGIQQALDAGADGILVPYVNNKAEAMEAVEVIKYPQPSTLKGTRSVYFPQRSSFKDGLLGYTPAWNENSITAVQVETADCIKNIDEILSVEGIDIAFLGKNDLAMSMGLFEKYEFPLMYTCPEMNEAVEKLKAAAKKHNKILGIFMFGTDALEPALKDGFNFVSLGNDLHHMLSASTTMLADVQEKTKKAGKEWKGLPSNLR